MGDTKHDPIREIDMSDPKNFQKAIELALAASDADGWGPVKKAWLHALAPAAEELWTAHKAVDGETVITSISCATHSRAAERSLARAST